MSFTMVPVPLALTVRQGETLSFALTPYQNDGTIFALAGASAHCAAASAPGSTPVFEGTTAGGQVALNATSGQVTATFGPAITATILAGTYPLDLFVLLAGGVRFCAGSGTVRVVAAITSNP